MNYSQPPTTASLAGPQAPLRRASGWTSFSEWLATPLAVGVMLTQLTLAVGVRLQLATLATVDAPELAAVTPVRDVLQGPTLLNEVMFIGAFLLCVWFALSVRALERSIRRPTLARLVARPLLAVGWLALVALTAQAVLTASALAGSTIQASNGTVSGAGGGDPSLQAIHDCLIVSVIYLLGLAYAFGPLSRPGPRHIALLSLFRLGFSLLIFGIALALVTGLANPAQQGLLGPLLTYGLPFVVSGLVALALTRLDAIALFDAQSPTPPADARVNWYRFALRWGLALVAASVALSLLFSLVGGFGGFGGFNFHLPGQGSGQGQRPGSGGGRGSPFGQPPATQTPTPPPSPPPDLSFLKFVAIILLALIALALLVYLGVLLWRRFHRALAEEPQGEETAARGGARRRRGQAPDAYADTVREYYRRFLQTTADAGGSLARRGDETPAEYEGRLRALLNAPDSPFQQQATQATQPAPETGAILDELTRAYGEERYGALPADETRRAWLRAWLPRLLAIVPRRAPDQF